MGSRLANLASWLREVLPEPLDPWFGNRWASPMVGSRYRVRSRFSATLATLPLGRESRRLSVSLPPTTAFVIHAATRSDEGHVYAAVDGADATELLAPADRTGITAGGCLLEIPRRVLDAQCCSL
jgi:hypothetical protein